MTRLYFNQKEIIFLKTVCELLDDNIEKNNIKKEQYINISAFAIAKKCGISYNSVRKNIRKIMEL